ncbi:alkyl hydroperoxide reductase/thiol specificantioxidant/Mal allergen [Monoraphidium neglectum]|uniref:Alkyl hydroperoxide reductase/thiol specificantioxidant/Mal allergen n=1 Tax=Monoraphidium neglectum TaxID=145388 RepID=A0A0D2LWX0_9CHLO|nr:alkyl hydroperoxide reductase/thiol specificantioxidant/Mal allergen [Monoraphidium neglectum]KIY94026.1 alkyl hydroperoxide reductase/thiol specificantioxidant/Mal allergen [Monoraphidium neglectum]|eukprot:XP_013893046.1 alkyl hydroperoxide reductase/thiol specificantioxidant/Mal allergen [Monoraphidium neglectum]
MIATLKEFPPRQKPATFTVDQLLAKLQAGMPSSVLTESCDLAIGTKAPDFELPEPLTGTTVKLADVAEGAKATLVMFGCVHCPFVVHLKGPFSKIAKDYLARGVKTVAISSNSVVTHPQDGPEFIAAEAKELGYTFPYLYDESQDVAKAYKVACTPEFFVFDADLRLAYHGQFDDTRPGGSAPVTGRDLVGALDAVLSGQPAPRAKPSIGCNLKWHPGKEPEWYGPQQVKK